MPRLRPDGTHYPSMQPKQCAECGGFGTSDRRVLAVDGVYAHKDCRQAKVCRVPDCCNKAHAKGYCSGHYNRRYYQQDPQRHRDRAKQWAEQNPEKRAANEARRTPESIRKSARDWYWRNRIRAIVAQQNIRAAKKGLTTVVTVEQMLGRLAMFLNRCYLCGGRPDGFDHVKPLSAGGLHIPANMRPCCTRCNTVKGATWNGVAPCPAVS